MAKSKETIAKSNAELLSYIINVTPILKENVPLPVQGESIVPIGELISSDQRYKNAFLNTVNLIGLTVVKRNRWENPWDFTYRGVLRFGQQVRELITDLADVKDYNDNVANVTLFLQNVVPDVYNYIHEINFQKFYTTTTSDSQLAMAFTSENGLYDLIDEIIAMNYESYKYDVYIVDKYMLCRRIVNGTVTPIAITNYATLTPRQRVSAMKSVSNKMTFRSPNYNPAGLRKASSFDDQFFILNTDFEADMTTEVLATSFFRNDAEFKARAALIDSFANHDVERLTQILGDKYIPFTDSEIAQLLNIPAAIISREWFMDYEYAFDTGSPNKTTEFYNPTTLRNNHFLHTWRVFSTSPFENACVFVQSPSSVDSITINPTSASLSVGATLQFNATVNTTNFANKAVNWSCSQGATITSSGLLTITGPTYINSKITVTATSIYDNTKSAVAEITVIE